MPYMIEHLATREEQHRDERDGGPEVAVLQEGPDVGRCDGEEGEEAEEGGRHDDGAEVVEGADYWGFGDVCGEMP